MSGTTQVLDVIVQYGPNLVSLRSALIEQLPKLVEAITHRPAADAEGQPLSVDEIKRRLGIVEATAAEGTQIADAEIAAGKAAHDAEVARQAELAGGHAQS